MAPNGIVLLKDPLKTARWQRRVHPLPLPFLDEVRDEIDVLLPFFHEGKSEPLRGV